MGKRTRSRRRGAGTGAYSSPSHRHHGPIVHPSAEITGPAIVQEISFAPGRTAPVAEVSATNGERFRLLAPAGLATGTTIALNAGPADRGSLLPLGEIPDGTIVCNIEVKPFDGGRLVRAAGTSALLVAHTGREVTIQLPSGHLKQLLGACRAQVGAVGGGGRTERPIVKAGKRVHSVHSLARSPFRVRGVAMNPVNHPFGGGAHQHVGRPSTVSAGAWPGAKVGRFSPKRRRWPRGEKK